MISLEGLEDPVDINDVGRPCFLVVRLTHGMCLPSKGSSIGSSKSTNSRC